ncbi:hypothetical protein [Endozoicomonas lisbonensis]
MLFEKIFSTANNYSVNAHWNKKNLSPVYNNSGICSGMVVTWLKKSITSEGRGVQSAAEFDFESISIIQASYAWKHTFPSKALSYSAGIPFLLQSQNLISLDSTSGEMNKSSSAGYISNWVLEKTGHFILLYFNGMGDDSLYNGHAIGFRFENGILELFNPNEGLYRYFGVSPFELDINVLFWEQYGNFEGKWYLHKVGLDM